MPKRKRNVAEGLNLQAIDTIPIPILNASDNDHDISTKDLEYIGSYNWVNSKSPAIVVPGSPPRWLGKEPPFTIPHDKGMHYIDQNGFRMSSMPLSPLVQAVDFTSAVENLPPTKWSSVDFVTDGRNLRKLLRWIDNRSHGNRAVRIDTQLAGEKTVLFSGWEEQTREWSQPMSWGHSFEDFSTVTAPGCAGTTGHHRIVQYHFGGLLMVVRCEVDAFDPSATQATANERPEDLNNSKRSSRLPSAQKAKKSINKEGVGLTVKHGGSVVAQSSIVELKSKSMTVNSTGCLRWAEVYPQLYVSQIPWCYKAIHRKGTFGTIEKIPLASMDKVGDRLKDSLRKLVLALYAIQRVVKEGGRDGRLSLVLRGGELKVFGRTSLNSCLPKEVMARFEIV